MRFIVSLFCVFSIFFYNKITPPTVADANANKIMCVMVAVEELTKIVEVFEAEDNTEVYFDDRNIASILSESNSLVADDIDIDVDVDVDFGPDVVVAVVSGTSCKVVVVVFAICNEDETGDGVGIGRTCVFVIAVVVVLRVAGRELEMDMDR